MRMISVYAFSCVNISAILFISLTVSNHSNMKTFKLFLFSFLFILIAQSGFAQSSKKETFQVSGECGMCKKKIETAAKNAGATYAVWNVDSKKLTVKYNSTSSNTAKIQQAVADAGYDTKDVKASEEAYNKLHDCCKYERTATASTNCCSGGTCSKEDKSCCADGDCSTAATCCKEESKDCCKKA